MKTSKQQKVSWIIIVIMIIVIIGLIAFFRNAFFEKEPDHSDEKTENKPMWHSLMSDGNNEIDKMIRDIMLDDELSITENVDYNMLNVGGEDYIQNENLPRTIKYKEKEYCSLDRCVESEYIGERLSEDVESEVELYTIKHMTSDLALAVKDVNQNKYYVYMTESYEVDSVKQFIEETGFCETVEVAKVRMSSLEIDEYSLVFYDGLVDYFFKSIQELSEDEYVFSEDVIGKRTGLVMEYYMPNIKKQVKVNFFESGDVQIYIEGSMFCPFFSGGEKGIEFATDLMEYLVENAKVYKVE